jgi:DegV family protein with EDD domain
MPVRERVRTVTQEVAIVSDTTLDVPDELVRRLRISLAPVHVLVEGKSYRDRIDISIEEVNRLMLEGKARLTTSGATAEDFLAAYEEALRLAPRVVAFSISPTLSVTYRSAVAARELLEDRDITVVETHTVLASMGLVVKRAAELALEGRTKEEILAFAGAAFQRVRMVATSHSTRFMEAGGRLERRDDSGESGFPILRIWEKGWREIDRATTREEALERLLDLMARDLDELGYRPGTGLHVAVDHIVCPEEADVLRAEVERRHRPSELHVWQIGPTAGVHLGPGTIGIAYLTLPEDEAKE